MQKNEEEIKKEFHRAKDVNLISVKKFEKYQN